MTLEQLRVFVAVAERQHVTRAAASLQLAQSSASAAIACLEARHGTKLFHRVGRGIELSEAGTVFLAEARAVLARVELAERTLEDLGGLKRGTLSVQASQTIASYWLPHHLVAFRKAHPGIDIKLSVGNTAQVAAAIHSGEAELGFVEGLVDDPSLTVEPVARDSLVLVVAPKHPWARAGRLSPADLMTTEWVFREPGSGTRSVFEAALGQFGFEPSELLVAIELPTNEAVRAAVEAGLGATALSASVAAPSIEAGLLVKVDLALPDRAFMALHHAERRYSRPASALMTIIGGSAKAA